MEMGKKSAAILVVIFIAIIAGFFYVSNLPAIDKTYSFTAGDLTVEKIVFGKGNTHTESISFESKSGRNYALITYIPKSLAQDVSDIQIETNGKIEVLKNDPIITSRYGQEPARISFDLINPEENSNDCIAGIFVPDELYAILTDSDKQEIANRLLEIEDHDLTCDEINLFEEYVAERADSFSNKQDIMTTLQDGFTHTLNLRTENIIETNFESDETTGSLDNIEIIFARGEFDGDVQTNTANLTNYRDQYKIPEKITLTVSEEIPKAYYEFYFNFPETIGGEEMDPYHPTITAQGEYSDKLNISIFGEQDPFLMTMELDLTDIDPIQNTKIQINIDFDLWLITNQTIEVIIQKNDCKEKEAELGDSAAALNSVAECYLTEARIGKVAYAETYEDLLRLVNMAQMMSPTTSTATNEKWRGYSFDFPIVPIDLVRTYDSETEESYYISYLELRLGDDPDNYLQRIKDKAKEADQIQKIVFSKYNKALETANKAVDEFEIATLYKDSIELEKNSWIAEDNLLQDPYSRNNRDAYTQTGNDYFELMLSNPLIPDTEQTDLSIVLDDRFEGVSELEYQMRLELASKWGPVYELTNTLQNEVEDLDSLIKAYEEMMEDGTITVDAELGQNEIALVKSWGEQKEEISDIIDELSTRGVSLIQIYNETVINESEFRKKIMVNNESLWREIYTRRITLEKEYTLPSAEYPKGEPFIINYGFAETHYVTLAVLKQELQTLDERFKHFNDVLLYELDPIEYGEIGWNLWDYFRTSLREDSGVSIFASDLQSLVSSRLLTESSGIYTIMKCVDSGIPLIQLQGIGKSGKMIFITGEERYFELNGKLVSIKLTEIGRNEENYQVVSRHGKFELNEIQSVGSSRNYAEFVFTFTDADSGQGTVMREFNGTYDPEIYAPLIIKVDNVSDSYAEVTLNFRKGNAQQGWVNYAKVNNNCENDPDETVGLTTAFSNPAVMSLVYSQKKIIEEGNFGTSDQELVAMYTAQDLAFWGHTDEAWSAYKTIHEKFNLDLARTEAEVLEEKLKNKTRAEIVHSISAQLTTPKELATLLVLWGAFKVVEVGIIIHMSNKAAISALQAQNLAQTTISAGRLGILARAGEITKDVIQWIGKTTFGKVIKFIFTKNVDTFTKWRSPFTRTLTRLGSGEAAALEWTEVLFGRWEVILASKLGRGSFFLKQMAKSEAEIFNLLKAAREQGTVSTLTAEEIIFLEATIAKEGTTIVGRGFKSVDMGEYILYITKNGGTAIVKDAQIAQKLATNISDWVEAARYFQARGANLSALTYTTRLPNRAYTFTSREWVGYYGIRNALPPPSQTSQGVAIGGEISHRLTLNAKIIDEIETIGNIFGDVFYQTTGAGVSAIATAGASATAMRVALAVTPIANGAAELAVISSTSATIIGSQLMKATSAEIFLGLIKGVDETIIGTSELMASFAPVIGGVGFTATGMSEVPNLRLVTAGEEVAIAFPQNVREIIANSFNTHFEVSGVIPAGFIAITDNSVRGAIVPKVFFIPKDSRTLQLVQVGAEEKAGLDRLINAIRESQGALLDWKNGIISETEYAAIVQEKTNQIYSENLLRFIETRQLNTLANGSDISAYETKQWLSEVIASGPWEFAANTNEGYYLPIFEQTAINVAIAEGYDLIPLVHNPTETRISSLIRNNPVLFNPEVYSATGSAIMFATSSGNEGGFAIAKIGTEGEVVSLTFAESTIASSVETATSTVNCFCSMSGNELGTNGGWQNILQDRVLVNTRTGRPTVSITNLAQVSVSKINIAFETIPTINVMEISKTGNTINAKAGLLVNIEEVWINSSVTSRPENTTTFSLQQQLEIEQSILPEGAIIRIESPDFAQLSGIKIETAPGVAEGKYLVNIVDNQLRIIASSWKHEIRLVSSSSSTGNPIGNPIENQVILSGTLEVGEELRIERLIYDLMKADGFYVRISGQLHSTNSGKISQIYTYNGENLVETLTALGNLEEVGNSIKFTDTVTGKNIYFTREGFETETFGGELIYRRIHEITQLDPQFRNSQSIRLDGGQIFNTHNTLQVTIGGSFGNERILISFENDEPLRLVYEHIRSNATQILDEARFAELPPTVDEQTTKILEMVYEEVSSIRYAHELVGRKIISIETDIKNVTIDGLSGIKIGELCITYGGVCRHSGIIAAAFVARLGEEGILSGYAITNAGGNHAWMEYHEPIYDSFGNIIDRRRFVIDGAQNKYGWLDEMIGEPVSYNSFYSNYQTTNILIENATGEFYYAFSESWKKLRYNVGTDVLPISGEYTMRGLFIGLTIEEELGYGFRSIDTYIATIKESLNKIQQIVPNRTLEEYYYLYRVANNRSLDSANKVNTLVASEIVDEQQARLIVSEIGKELFSLNYVITNTQHLNPEQQQIVYRIVNTETNPIIALQNQLGITETAAHSIMAGLQGGVPIQSIFEEITEPIIQGTLEINRELETQRRIFSLLNNNQITLRLSSNLHRSQTNKISQIFNYTGENLEGALGPLGAIEQNGGLIKFTDSQTNREFFFTNRLPEEGAFNGEIIYRRTYEKDQLDIIGYSANEPIPTGAIVNTRKPFLLRQYGETLSVNFETDNYLQQMYGEILDEIQSINPSTVISEEEETLRKLEIIYNKVNEVPYNSDVLVPYANMPLGEFCLANNAVCRHHAALAATMTARLGEEGLLPGYAINNSGLQHAWMEYIEPVYDSTGTIIDRRRYIIDVSQNNKGWLDNSNNYDLWYLGQINTSIIGESGLVSVAINYAFSEPWVWAQSISGTYIPYNTTSFANSHWEEIFKSIGTYTPGGIYVGLNIDNKFETFVNLIKKDLTAIKNIVPTATLDECKVIYSLAKNRSTRPDDRVNHIVEKGLLNEDEANRVVYYLVEEDIQELGRIIPNHTLEEYQQILDPNYIFTKGQLISDGIITQEEADLASRFLNGEIIPLE